MSRTPTNKQFLRQLFTRLNRYGRMENSHCGHPKLVDQADREKARIMVMVENRLSDLSLAIQASESVDWQQVVSNGGPPCFAVCGGRFCLRAKRWHDGHADPHKFVSLNDLLKGVAS